MFPDFEYLVLCIMAWSSLVTFFDIKQFSVKYLVVVLLSVLTIISPYYLNVGYLDPFTGMGMVIDTVIAIALAPIGLAIYAFLEEVLENKNKEFQRAFFLILFIIFIFFPFMNWLSIRSIV